MFTEGVRHVALLHGFGISGSNSCTYIMDLARALERRGTKVSLFTHELREKEFYQFGHAEKVDFSGISFKFIKVSKFLTIYSLHITPIPLSYNREDIKEGKLLRNWEDLEISRYISRYTEAVSAVHRSMRFDMILANHLNLLSRVCKNLYRRFALPFKLIVHGTSLECVVRKDPRVKKIVENSVSDLPESVVVLNEFVRERFLEEFPDLETCCLEIPPGVDLERYRLSSQEREGMSYVGRLSYDKGIHCLLFAMPLILEKLPGLKLSLVGDGPDKESLMEAWQMICQGEVDLAFSFLVSDIARNRSEQGAYRLIAPIEKFLRKNTMPDFTNHSQVLWVGHISRDRAYSALSRSRVNILPSLVPEAHPLSLCESLASGTFSLGVKSAGVSSILSKLERDLPEFKGRTLFSRDPDKMITELIAQVVDNFSTPHQLENSCKLEMFAKRNYSWDLIVNKLLALDVYQKRRVS